MKNNIVKINESTLRQIVAESVKKVLKEEDKRWMYSDETLNAIQESYNVLNGLYGLLRQEEFPEESIAAEDSKKLRSEISSCMRCLGEYLFYL